MSKRLSIKSKHLISLDRLQGSGCPGAMLALPTHHAPCIISHGRHQEAVNISISPEGMGPWGTGLGGGSPSCLTPGPPTPWCSETVTGLGFRTSGPPTNEPFRRNPGLFCRECRDREVWLHQDSNRETNQEEITVGGFPARP